MKLNKWLFGAAAALMLGACSDNFTDAPDVPEQPTETGSGYIGISIQMPTENGTRAFDENNETNAGFDHGDPKEYKLVNATLVLFACDDADVMTGTGDNKVYDPENDIARNAKCIGAFSLQKSKDAADEVDNQITTQVTRFARVSDTKISDKKKLYALVIANGDKYGLTPGDITNKETGMIGKTIKQFQEKEITSTLTTNQLYTQATRGVGYAEEILMTNSPLSEHKGGKDDPNGSQATIEVLPVLVELNPTTYPTEDEAVAKPAGTIHIERAVGKVTCSSFNKDTWVTVNVDDETYLLVVDDIKWDLGNDLAKTYLVRNTNRKPVDPSLAGNDFGSKDNMWAWNYKAEKAKNYAQYRMIGHTAIDVDGTDYYRPYFCQVPGYNKAVTGDNDREDKPFLHSNPENINPETKVGYMEFEDAVECKANYAFYPHENTFPVEYQKYANTTRIGFWVNFKFKKVKVLRVEENGKPITEDVLGTDGKPIYLNMTDADKSFYIRGLDKSVIYTENPLIGMALNYIKGLPEVKKAVTDAMKKEYDENGNLKEGSYDNLELDKIIDIKFAEHRDDNGEVEIVSVAFKKRSDMSDQLQAKFESDPSYDFSDLIGTLNGLETVKKYKGGRAFYEVRIKHFGDDQTPWNPDDYDKASTIDDSYGTDPATRNNNFLGRYGIVRNNWYDLNVSIIRRLGPPADPAKYDDTWPGTPDDSKDEYISVKVRVLSWAKRSQNVEF